jgi:ABC-type nitrate/sulfonate/bicarbonate transport system permease component
MFGVLGFAMSAILLFVERRLLRWKRGLQSRRGG